MTDFTQLNKEFYEDENYTEDVREFMKAYDKINTTKGTEIEDQLTCKETGTLNKHATTYLTIISIFDKYCEHFTTIPQFCQDAIGLPIFIQLKQEYSSNITQSIELMNKELQFLEGTYIQVDIIYNKDNSYPKDFLPPAKHKVLFKYINEHYDQEIYCLESKFFDETGRIKNWEEYRERREELKRNEEE